MCRLILFTNVGNKYLASEYVILDESEFLRFQKVTDYFYKLLSFSRVKEMQFDHFRKIKIRNLLESFSINLTHIRALKIFSYCSAAV